MGTEANGLFGLTSCTLSTELGSPLAEKASKENHTPE